MSGTGVVVVGSFMMDLVVRAPRRPQPGETLVGTSFDVFLGGKGCNQAIAAARAGAATAMIGRLGADDFGARFLDRLAAEGIDATGVTIDPDEGTGRRRPARGGRRRELDRDRPPGQPPHDRWPTSRPPCRPIERRRGAAPPARAAARRRRGGRQGRPGGRHHGGAQPGAGPADGDRCVRRARRRAGARTRSRRRCSAGSTGDPLGAADGSSRPARRRGGRHGRRAGGVARRRRTARAARRARRRRRRHRRRRRRLLRRPRRPPRRRRVPPRRRASTPTPPPRSRVTKPGAEPSMPTAAEIEALRCSQRLCRVSVAMRTLVLHRRRDLEGLPGLRDRLVELVRAGSGPRWRRRGGGGRCGWGRCGASCAGCGRWRRRRGAGPAPPSASSMSSITSALTIGSSYEVAVGDDAVGVRARQELHAPVVLVDVVEGEPHAAGVVAEVLLPERLVLVPRGLVAAAAVACRSCASTSRARPPARRAAVTRSASALRWAMVSTRSGHLSSGRIDWPQVGDVGDLGRDRCRRVEVATDAGPCSTGRTPRRTAPAASRPRRRW